MARQHDFDIVVVGGGMVGASLASALSGQGLRIAVVEARPFSAPDHASFDDRSVALSWGSHRILDSLGLWQALDLAGVCPIETIHVSDRGHIGSARLRAEDEGVEALGYVVENRVLGSVLAQRFAEMDDVTLFSPATPRAVDIGPNRARLRLQHGEETLDIDAALLVAADGGDSLLRQWQGIETFQRDYGQTAIIANVATAQAHHNVAYERFTDTGPLAMLPLSAPVGTGLEGQGRCSLVWTAQNSEVETIMGWDEATFTQRLQARFGHRLGDITHVGLRSAYPLRMMQVREAVRERLVVIGNAAHMLHPVAGQGFNLGLRDVASLAQLVVDGHRIGHDIGDMALLSGYRQGRRNDTLRTLFFTDSLVRAFSNDFKPLALLRNLGLLALDTVPALKHQLARQAMGLAGTQTRLARGLPL
ncbi:MAG: 2-octaprenyl-6-methoxyphenyl hydroxylase [Gammaproteobacteria bacterium]|nr:2-octaprenyl-6-methoxyphenyl hydroxylase [Gammaproteobacteria bacterium]